MSQKYKDKYEELRNNDIGQKETVTNETEHAFYDMPGNARMVTFAWPDGRELFLNYAYLVSGEITEAGETTTLFLTFTTHQITIKGHGLQELFVSLTGQTAKTLRKQDPRYTAINGEKARISEILAENR
ncbi:hypothetical protein SanaruYs_00460 [Chryseotalea sanaruensis]|uniref:Uncharacterized protein n=1 Tax=Chryseotalea sanaruensis TaxID=2482724 RepID=A0A401U4N3_9BACT|nr:hypothetical protein [Chryseotalea sanaruensis]GCC49832.1 hypothetical protein SanaruYs_00460 [Chryseotalea sanaruensis]